MAMTMKNLWARAGNRDLIKSTFASDWQHLIGRHSAEGLLARAAFIVVLAVPLCILRAWVIVQIWQWYIVPGFNLPAIHMITAWGLSVMSAAFHVVKPNRYDIPSKYRNIILESVSQSLAVLLSAWIGTLFI